jgi:hypothetical protein
VISQNVINPGACIPFSHGRHFSRGTGVQWTNPLEHSDWDEQITGQNSPARSIFHSTAWAKALTETYGFEPIYFVSKESGAVHSVLPLMEVNSALTGKRAVALPFTDTCEPLCADKIEFSALFRNAVELAQARNWKYLEFRGGGAFLNGTAPSLSFYGHHVEIPADQDAFFAQLKSPVRRAIRKAEKSGVRVEISRDLAAVKQYYVLHCKSRRRHGLPPQPFSFFRNIQRHVLSTGLGSVVLARWQKVPVAGAIFFHSGDKAIYKFGASDDSFQELRGNNLMFHEAIRWLSRNGVRKLDLGRTSTNNEGLRRFKLGWNAEEVTLDYFRFCLRQMTFVPMRDEGSGWHNSIFKALPLPASRLAGEILYRHWA